MLSWEKPLVKPMAPGSILHYIIFPSTSYFCRCLFCNLYFSIYTTKIPKIFILLSLSDLTFASGHEGIDNPIGSRVPTKPSRFEHWGAREGFLPIDPRPSSLRSRGRTRWTHKTKTQDLYWFGPPLWCNTLLQCGGGGLPLGLMMHSTRGRTASWGWGVLVLGELVWVRCLWMSSPLLFSCPLFVVESDPLLWWIILLI